MRQEDCYEFQTIFELQSPTLSQKASLKASEPHLPTISRVFLSASQGHSQYCGRAQQIQPTVAHLRVFITALIIAMLLFQALGFEGDHMGPALPQWCFIVNPWTGRSLFSVSGSREALLSKRAGLIFLCSGLCPGGPVCLFRESWGPSLTCPLGSAMLQVGALGLRVVTVGKAGSTRTFDSWN